MAPVVVLGDFDAYVLRHGAGYLVVEIVHALQPLWDAGANGSVELIALEEFVAITEKEPPATNCADLTAAARRAAPELA